MDKIEIKKMLEEVIKENPKSRKMEFSKKLMIFASGIYAATWIVAAVSWFYIGKIPHDLIQFATWLYGAGLVSYCGKSAYENKYKIGNGL